MAVVTLCPECAHRLKLGARLHVGQRKICSNCNANLEVASLNPLVLDTHDTQTPNRRAAEKKKVVAEGFCPNCDYAFSFGPHPRQGQRIICPECRSPLEVVGLDPLELDISVGVWKKSK
jgi:lysine biosynthesis protein LysW